jgi:transcriptional regulator with XRE-family HTH domain
VEIKQLNHVKANIRYLMDKSQIANILELSKQTCISQAVLYKISAGTSKSPTIDTFIELSMFFNISIDDLLNTYIETKDKQNICKLESLSQTGIQDTNITILTNIDLSSSAISLKVDVNLKNIPYIHMGDILTFEEVVDSVSYPKVCLVKDNSVVSIEMIHLADTDLYVNRKKMLGGYRTLLFSEFYTDKAEIIYELSSTIFR